MSGPETIRRDWERAMKKYVCPKCIHYNSRGTISVLHKRIDRLEKQLAKVRK